MFRFIKILVAFATLSLGLAQAQVEITDNLGDQIASDLANSMPGLAGSAAGQALATRIGDVTYTGYTFVGGEYVFLGTNTGGSISATVTVTNTGSFTGSFTVGATGVFSGTAGATIGQSSAGTWNMSIEWHTKMTDDGQLMVTYKVGVGQEIREGARLLPIKKEHLDATGAPSQDGGGGSSSGGGSGYDWATQVILWYNDQFWNGVPDGTVSWGDIQVVDWGYDNGHWDLPS